jgi:hypothetical protein
MNDSWGELAEMATDLVRVKAKGAKIVDSDLNLTEDQKQAHNDLLRQATDLAQTGTSAVWSRRVTHEIMLDLEASRTKGEYGVLGTLQLVKVTGAKANHLHSARLDWLSTFNRERGDSTLIARATAIEVASRYFDSVFVPGDDTRTLVPLIFKILEDFADYTARANKKLDSHGEVSFNGAKFANKVSFFQNRVNVIAAIGLALPRQHGGQSLTPGEALQRANQQQRLRIPKYVIQNFATAELATASIRFDLMWEQRTEDGPQVRIAEFEAGQFISGQMSYSSGMPAATVDSLEGGSKGVWLTLIVPTDAYQQTLTKKPVVGSDAKITYVGGGTLQDALLQMQSATWLTHKRYGKIKITIGTVSYICAANNFIINDIGDGSTPTYGPSRCATLRAFVQPSASSKVDPVVPSVHTLLSSDGQRPAVSAINIADLDIRIPLVLDAKALSCVSVLFTILSKADTITTGGEVAKVASRLYLSSSFGLESPSDINYHIDFLIGCFYLLDPFFATLARLSLAESNALMATLLSDAKVGTKSGTALDHLRKGRNEASRYLAQPANRAEAAAFAWAVVESSTVVIWLITYLSTGLSPIAYPHRYNRPPKTGIEALTYIMRHSFAQWCDKDDLSRPLTAHGMKNHTLRLLLRLGDKDSKLMNKLIKCKRWIADSPNFLPN